MVKVRTGIALTRSRESVRSRAKVVYVLNFLIPLADIALNPSLHKSQHVYGIVLILVASCSFRCTLSLYLQCVYLHSVIA